MENKSVNPANKKGFKIPPKIKYALTAIILFFIAAILAVYGYLILVNPKYLEPDKFGLQTFLLVLLGALLVMYVPWAKLPFYIKKAWGLELEQKVDTQAKNSAIENAELQKQIDTLQANLQKQIDHINSHRSLKLEKNIANPVVELNLDKSPSLSEKAVNLLIKEIRENTVEQSKSDLEEVLSGFLKQYNSWAFSPLRIHRWGAMQPGYESLGKYSLEEIKTELRRLLAKKYVAVSISKKGNTLFKFNTGMAT